MESRENNQNTRCNKNSETEQVLQSLHSECVKNDNEIKPPPVLKEKQPIEKRKAISTSFISLFYASFLGGIFVLFGIICIIYLLEQTDIILPFIKKISPANRSDAELEKQIANLEKRFFPLFTLSEKLSSLRDINNDFVGIMQKNIIMIQSSSTHIQEKINFLSKTINALRDKIPEEISNIIDQSTKSIFFDFQSTIGQRLDLVETRFKEFFSLPLHKEIHYLRSLIEKQENNLKILKKNVQALREHEQNMTRLVAANTLKVAVDSGRSYEEEWRFFSSVVLQKNNQKNNAENLKAWKLLNDYAQEGLPSVATLSAIFAKTADEIVRTENSITDDASIWKKLWLYLQSLIVKRSIGEIEGITTAALTARMEMAISKGDYIQAIDLWHKLPQLAKDVSVDFITQLCTRHEVDTLLSKFRLKTLADYETKK